MAADLQLTSHSRPSSLVSFSIYKAHTHSSLLTTVHSHCAHAGNNRRIITHFSLQTIASHWTVSIRNCCLLAIIKSRPSASLCLALFSLFSFVVVGHRVLGILLLLFTASTKHIHTGGHLVRLKCVHKLVHRLRFN